MAMHKRLIGISVALMTVLSAWSAQGGGFSNPDFGVRRVGMFAVIGKPDDVTAVFHNPAGLTLLDGTQFYHAQSWFFNETGLKMYNSRGDLLPLDHDVSPEWSIGFIPFIGMASDFGTDDFRAGFGIYAPNAYGAALPEDEPTRYHATRALFLASRATGSVAYRLSPKLSIGASASLIYVNLWAKRDMNFAVLNDPDERFKDKSETEPDDYELTVSGDDWTWSVDIAVLLEPTPDFKIGAVFAGGSAITLEGDVELREPVERDPNTGKVVGKRDIFEKATQKTDMVIPFTMQAGFNWEFVEDFEFGMDVRYWHYQVLQEQATKLSNPIMGQPGFDDPKNFGNSWAWCAGFLHRINPRWEVMVGYQQDFTPIPTRTLTLDNPSRDQQGFSLGVRWQATENVRLGAAFVRNWFDLVDVQDSLATPPTNAKGHGANSELGLDISWQL